MNAAGLALVKHYEGFRGDAYLDVAGVPTIGFGHTMGVELGDTITEQEAEALLVSELERYRPTCAGTENQLSAMQSLAYNIGVPAFMTSTVKRKHLAGDYAGAGDAFLLWDKATVQGKLIVLPGLVKRRRAERQLYRGV